MKSQELTAEDIWQQGEGTKDVSLKAIPLHRVALRLEMGKLKKYDSLSSVVSEHGLSG